MTVITTVNYNLATAYSNQRKVARCQNGVLWAVSAGDSTVNGALKFHYSTDNGATWTAGGVLLAEGGAYSYTPSSSIFIDEDDYAHLAYKHVTNGYIYYRRGTPNAARTAWTWSAAMEVHNHSNVDPDHPDVVAHREGTGWQAHVVYALKDMTGATTYRASYNRVSIASGGQLSVLSRVDLGSHGNTNYTYPSIDFNHTGDGKTVAGGTPHLYVAWSAGAASAGYGIRFKKATYSGGSWTWGTEREIDSTRYIPSAAYWLNCLFDGTRVVIVGHVYDGANHDIVLHDRDAADTATTSRTLVENAATSQFLLSGSASYDSSGNVYVFGRDYVGANGTHTLRYRRWTRATATFETAVSIDTSASDFPYVSSKRGYSNNRIEFIYTDGTASPYNVTYDSISLNTAPNAPTLTAPINSVIIDKDASQQFSWSFNDPDAGDVQSAYELQYRVTGTSTWTVVSGGASENHTFAAGTFSVGDYEWQVRTWDNAGVVGPWSSSGLFSAAATPAAPTISDPANNGTINSNPYDVHWTTSVQDAVQVRTVADNAGSPDTTTIYYESIVIEEPSRRVLSVPFNTNNRTEHVQVRVRDGGLWSSWASVLVNVSYTESQPGNLTVTPEPEMGRVRVEFTPPTPAAGEPTIIDNDLHRKVNGVVEYIKIAKGLGSTFTYFDYNVKGGTAWEYQVLSYADNNTTVYSVPQVITPMQLVGSWIHDVINPSATVNQFIYNDNAGDEDYENEKSLFRTAGNAQPFVEFGEGHTKSITVRFFIPSDQIGSFRELLRGKRILHYRDFYNRGMYCIAESLPVQRTRDGGYSTVKFTEVYYQEAV